MDVTKPLIDAILHSPQLLGVVLTIAASNLHNAFTKVKGPDDKTKGYLQLVYLVLSGAVYMLDQYMGGNLGNIDQDAIKNALQVWTAMVTTHFIGGKAVDEGAKVVDEKVKPKLAKISAKFSKKG